MFLCKFVKQYTFIKSIYSVTIEKPILLNFPFKVVNASYIYITYTDVLIQSDLQSVYQNSSAEVTLLPAYFLWVVIMSLQMLIWSMWQFQQEGRSLIMRQNGELSSHHIYLKGLSDLWSSTQMSSSSALGRFILYVWSFYRLQFWHVVYFFVCRCVRCSRELYEGCHYLCDPHWAPVNGPSFLEVEHRQRRTQGSLTSFCCGAFNCTMEGDEMFLLKRRIERVSLTPQS